jgi:hypothetical protein
MMAKFLIITGCVLILLGLLWPLIEKSPLGRLPGDIWLKGENTTFYFPIVTCLVISLLISLVLWLFSR